MLTVFSALVVGVAVWVLAAGLSDRPVVAVLVNLLVAGGLAPAIWLSRGLPVLRWMGAGAAAGSSSGGSLRCSCCRFPRPERRHRPGWACLCSPVVDEPARRSRPVKVPLHQ